MAAALTAFVDRQRAIVVDTNIRRVAGRAYSASLIRARQTTPDQVRARTRRRSAARISISQAEMDIANAVCHVRSPDCAACPLKDACLAHPLFANGRSNVRVPKRRNESARKTLARPHLPRPHFGLDPAHGPTPIAHLGAKADETYRPTGPGWVEAMVGRLAADGVVEVDEKTQRPTPRA